MIGACEEWPSRMDFFYHHLPIVAKVSVEFIDNNEPNTAFFDRVSIGSEDLKGLFPWPPPNLAVNISPESKHPSFPSTGLTFWVTPHDNKAREEILQAELPAHKLTCFVARVHLAPPDPTITRCRPAIIPGHRVQSFSYFPSASNKGGPLCTDQERIRICFKQSYLVQRVVVFNNAYLTQWIRLPFLVPASRPGYRRCISRVLCDFL